jgi:hypothetical protein
MPPLANATPGNATPGILPFIEIVQPTSIHQSAFLKSPSILNNNEMYVMDEAHKQDRQDSDATQPAGESSYWGRDRPLNKSDLLAGESIEQLFEYATRRGRFERTELDRLRFEALCLYCARRGYIPGALLTRCVFGAPSVSYIAASRDEKKAAERLRARELPSSSPAVKSLAEAFARRTRGAGRQT